LVKDFELDNEEKMLIPSQEARTERASNLIDLQPDIRPPSPERNIKNGPNVVVRSKEEPNLEDIPSTNQTSSKLKNRTEEQAYLSVRQTLPTGEAEILADLQRDDLMVQRMKNTRSSSLHRISVETKPSTQLKNNYPVQTPMQSNFSYSDSTDDDSDSFDGSSSDDMSFAPSKPLQNTMGGTELPGMTDEFLGVTNNGPCLSPTSKRKLLSGKNISRDRMSARIRASSPQNNGNASFHSIRPLKVDGVSSTNHAATARRNRLASTQRARSADKNLHNQGEDDLGPPSNIGKQLRMKRLQQQKIETNFRKGRGQQVNNGDRTFTC